MTNPAVMAFWHIGMKESGHGDTIKQYTIAGLGSSWEWRWVLSGRWPR